ncbi:hypothetical protein MXB_4362 [Myxobolus squamalis]|nr:hypothetical protein MXB_4362 [Myxobolus squamalis]
MTFEVCETITSQILNMNELFFSDSFSTFDLLAVLISLNQSDLCVSTYLKLASKKISNNLLKSFQYVKHQNYFDKIQKLTNHILLNVFPTLYPFAMNRNRYNPNIQEKCFFAFRIESFYFYSLFDMPGQVAYKNDHMNFHTTDQICLAVIYIYCVVYSLLKECNHLVTKKKIMPNIELFLYFCLNSINDITKTLTEEQATQFNENVIFFKDQIISIFEKSFPVFISSDYFRNLPFPSLTVTC